MALDRLKRKEPEGLFHLEKIQRAFSVDPVNRSSDVAAELRLGPSE